MELLAGKQSSTLAKEKNEREDTSVLPLRYRLGAHPEKTRVNSIGMFIPGEKFQAQTDIKC